MGFKDSLIQGVRDFSNSAGKLKGSLGVGLVSIIFHFVGILTDYWLLSGSSENDHQGLWNYCQDAAGYECCATLTDHVDNKGTSIPSYIVATQVFVIFGLILAISAFIATLVILFSPQSYNTCAKCLTSLYVIAAFCLLITVSVYGGQYKLHNLTREYNLHVSFGLTVTSMFLYVIAFGLYMCSSPVL